MEYQESNCEKIKESLSAYIDGELTIDEINSIDEHLSQCDCCKNELESLSNLCLNLSKTLNKNDFPMPDITDAVLERFIQKENINCDKVNDNLSMYFDGELDTKTYYSIENHLDKCPTCNENYQKYKHLRNLIKLSVDSVDIDLWDKVYTRLILPGQLECNFVLYNLSGYLDKEIEGDLIRKISKHILSCKECRKEFEDIKEISQLTKYALMAPANNIDLWPGVCHKFNNEVRKRTFSWSAAASVVVMFLVWNALSVTFPAPDLKGPNYSVASSDHKEISKAVAGKIPKMIPYDLSSSDDYLFTSVYNDPPSGVIPIMYQDNGSGEYDY